MKIVCAAICKNEEHNVLDFVQNLASNGITDLCIVDTGSTDRTVELLESTTVLPIHIKHIVVEPFDFSVAKNSVKDLIPADADMVLHLDLDERIVSLPENIDSCCVYTCERMEVLYGMVSIDMVRLTPANDWHWIHPIHESLVFKSRMISSSDSFIIAHHQRPDKDCYESLTEYWFQHDAERLYSHRLTDLIHNKRYKEYVELFREHGSWNLTGLAQWRAVKNYISSLWHCGDKPELEYIDVMKNFQSSSTCYYISIAYSMLDDEQNAHYWLDLPNTMSFDAENERIYYNQNVRDSAAKLYNTKFTQ